MNNIPADLAQSEPVADPTPEIELLLAYLSAHKMEFLKSFLRERGLRFSYRKDMLPVKVREYVDDGRLAIDDLVNLLNLIEGWGRQHIYLYYSPGPLSQAWRDPQRVRAVLHEAGYDDLFNQSKPLVLPDEPTLSSIEWSPTRARFIWVVKRTWHERDPELDQGAPIDARSEGVLQEQIVWQAYRVKTARGLIAFDWDLISNEATMLIQRLPSGTGYSAVRDQFELELRKFFDIAAFEKVRITRALRPLEQNDEIRRHRIRVRSDNRGTIEVTSPSVRYDVFSDDPVIERTRQAWQNGTTGLQGNFIWKRVPGQLTREVYTQIYGQYDNDQRIGILAEHTEDDVRYVLSRIRHYCV